MQASGEYDCCWICLEQGPLHSQEPIKVCTCPTKVHPLCLIRWQIQSCGREEECSCRFCHGALPCWKEHVWKQFGVHNMKHTVYPRILLDFGEHQKIIKVPLILGSYDVNNATTQFKAALAPFHSSVAHYSFVCKNPFSPREEIRLAGLQGLETALFLSSINAFLRYKRNRTFFSQLCHIMKIRKFNRT